MHQKQILYCSIKHSVVLLALLLTLLLGACINQDLSHSDSTIKEKTAHTSSVLPAEQWKLPISIPEGEFYKIIGWASDNEVIYITNQEQTSALYRYNLLSGTSELLYNSNSPIITGLFSPAKQYILIHSSPSSYEGIVTIIDINGNQKMSQSIPSHELNFEWNPFNEAEILVSKFNEDWTFQTFILNIKDKVITELSLPQPFIKWHDEGTVMYLNWDNEEPGLFAPLMNRSLKDGSETMLIESVIHYNLFKNQLMTITVDSKEPAKSEYSFYNQQLQKTLTFSIPQLAMYSDWLIPYYDYNERKKQFITMQPVSSGDADSYTEGFNLVSYNVNNGNQVLIFKGLENAPVLFSPSGEKLLYGHHFEKVVDVKTKKIYSLFEE
ncbi:YqgU-like beta propeller domain-containing protein [Neobacillus dielmonensis]|uniref:YqgU-like beta propeller domain-containing protein n=1 Tax=Neobacillus dielmonensis TaxID=1347369 RepID=UPI0005A5E0CF|nr:hypothetical protein [Neobacillus dielmonensis]